MKEGFKGQRILSFPEESIASFLTNRAVRGLFITRIGFFPDVKYHYNQKDAGVDYVILVYCIQGKGWFEIENRIHHVEPGSYFILPAGTPYRFGADNDDPWSIYWIHFKGDTASAFVPHPVIPRPISAGEDSRIQERIDLVEEMYHCLESGFIRENYEYACACLHHLLASFIHLQAFRKERRIVSMKKNVGDQAIHHMKEHIHEKLPLPELAAKYHLSVTQFSFLFKQHTSYSPIDYFIRLKIQRACQYIDLTHLKISEIARLVGFEDVSYFSRLFSHVMNMPPTKYRRQLQE